ncbi:flagellar biosynthesis anti-sigma factor FlgM [Diaphorobacter nitroreducens]|uniref:flagellar biosynthesis anti-sigma factor FlgM n=1 Tax=Diaphorobacter nitroreducens TaxID=164759 RepID=UPI0035AE2415
MKIGHNPETANALTQAAANRQQAKAAAPAPAEAAAQGASRAAAGVPVTLSATARSAEVGRSTADFNAEKVKAVKTAISEGTFVVNAEVVADKLLANAYETLSHSRG